MEKFGCYPVAMDELETNDVRFRIVVAAAKLIDAGGSDAATTRAIASAANVQAPTIYRLFRDKRGLLDAVAEHVLADYVVKKAGHPPQSDPVLALRDGWDMHVAFGLAHPELYMIMNSQPHLSAHSPAIASGLTVLRKKIRKTALAGRLKVSEERAIALIQSGCTGTVLTLLRKPAEQRDSGLSEVAREAILTAITGEAIAPTNPANSEPSRAAATLRSALDQTSVLTDGERHLLEELLDRIADGNA